MATQNNKSGVSEQVLSLPKGGGAVKGMGEKFQPDLHTGTGNFGIPLNLPAGRGGFGPQLSLSYSTGAGNGAFGLGWSLSIPHVARQTSKGIPVYNDESDTFILAGAEDLVEVSRTQDGSCLTVFYRPRTEGLFARIEHIADAVAGDDYWKVTTQDGTHSIHGRHPDSRIFVEEKGVRKVFAWYLAESRDTKGNQILYHYKRDTGPVPDDGQHDFNQVYISRIDYGNYHDTVTQTEPFLFQVDFDYGEFDDQEQDSQQWPLRPDAFSSYRSGFEIRTARRCQRILIRSLHPDANAPTHLIRSYDLSYGQDPLSQVSLLQQVQQRGYALQQPGVNAGTVHRNTNLFYWAFPPLSLAYSTFDPGKRTIEALTFECAHPPEKSLADPNYELIDLYGNGLPDILCTTDSGYYCWRNLGNSRFAAPRRLDKAPAGVTLAQESVQFADLNGNGSADLLVTEGSARGFYENDFSGEWGRFHPLRQSPAFSLKDPNVCLVDMDGDGVIDVLATFEHHFLYIRNSSTDDGGLEFDAPMALPRRHDPENWPDVYFAHPENRVRLADMTGDGLQDLVLIYDGRIDYWPNLGHGNWGRRITLLNGPHLPGRYDPRRLFLADITGDGVADLVFVAANTVHYWINQNGNRWSDEQQIPCGPPVTDADSVRIADIHGTGTGGILWSHDWTPQRNGNYRYLDFTGGEKPHLLVSVDNHLGAETHVHYVSSVQHYIADFGAGNPWITTLPFAVNVVDRVESLDRISHNRFVTQYAYHHGYYDGQEREFRGFGRVEQWDTQAYAALSANSVLPAATNIDKATHVPPLMTRTWFHTGAYLEEGRISRQFEEEYYQEPRLTEPQLGAMLLNDTVLPDTLRQPNAVKVPHSLSPQEKREACRTLHGAILRQEVYALDSTEQAQHPYSVTESNYAIELLQAKGTNRHAVFFIHPRQALDFHYERKQFNINGQWLADPRVSHAMTLAVDDFGNVLQSVAIGYGRRHEDPDPVLTNDDRDRQGRVLITYTDIAYTKAIDTVEAYHGPLPCETSTFELLKIIPAANEPLVTNLFGFEEMRAKIASAADGQHDLPYEDIDGTGAQADHPYRHLIEQVRSYYRKDDLSGALPLGELEALALPFESHQLAFTPELAKHIYVDSGKLTAAELENVLAGDGKYVHSEVDANWWIPSGRVYYSPDPNHNPVQELAFAHQHYFLPHRVQDPFGESAISIYDEFSLLLLETQDPLKNKITAGERDAQGNIINRNDYRVLQPALVTDPNGNRAQVAFDALGMVVGTAVMGKPGENMGDALIGFQPDLDENLLQAHLQNPLQDPHAILQQATSRLVYDLFAYDQTRDDPQPQPAVMYTLVRETHQSELQVGQQTKVQHGFSYSDGFGREIQKKVQAEPGPLVDGGPDVSPRWVGSGWTVFNNKGKPVRQYEPFFSGTHVFEFAKHVGVSPILFYDPAERVVATLYPNHTYEKVVFDPWRQESWDVNDTCVQADPKNDLNAGHFFFGIPAAEYQPTWHTLRTDPGHAVEAAQRWLDAKTRAAEAKAATKAAAHADTPILAYFDTLGRPFLTVADNGAAGKYANRVELDIEGNQRSVIDAKDRIVMRYDYDLLGHSIHQASMEAGRRWILIDVAGNPIRIWDSRGHQFQTEYDALRRPIHANVIGADPQDANKKILYERTEYGESQPNGEQHNLRTRIFRLCDGAGIVTNDAYDFKGNLLSSQRRLAELVGPQDAGIPAYKAIVDWSANIQQEAGAYTSSTVYDALNRPIQIIAPHDVMAINIKTDIIQPHYNEGNLLDKIDVWLKRAGEADFLLDPQTADLHAVNNIDYNAKGQRTVIEYGVKGANGTDKVVRTEYAYDPETSRLVHLLTRRDQAQFPGDCPLPHPAGWPGCQVQNLRYTYDPAGNITTIRDDAQQTVYFRNQRVEPSSEYTYDAIYRLVEAQSREHSGQAGQPWTSWDDKGRVNLDHPHDGQAMRRYTEIYHYDPVGNFLQFIHKANNGNWQRDYAYNEPSLIDLAMQSNRLSSTALHTNGAPPLQEPYTHDDHGNMTSMPHLSLMQWDFQDQLQITAKQVNNGGIPEKTYYLYDAGGQRVRKITERSVTAQQVAAGQTPKRLKERIYLGGFEIYREYAGNGSTIAMERETLHIVDDQQRIALVETRTQGNDDTPLQLIRYQLGNYLDSASVELNEKAQVISYEEYSPYGSTVYQAVDKNIKVAAKRYRYTGKERDEETGLNYHGARYYSVWLGRWASCDPLGIEWGASSPSHGSNSRTFNLYSYVANNPAIFIDKYGLQESQNEQLGLPSRYIQGVWGTEINLSKRAPPVREHGGIYPGRPPKPPLTTCVECRARGWEWHPGPMGTDICENPNKFHLVSSSEKWAGELLNLLYMALSVWSIASIENSSQAASLERTRTLATQRSGGTIVRADTSPATTSVAGQRYKTTPMSQRYVGEETGSVWGSKVKYLNEAERAAYKVEVRGGKLYTASGKLFDTSRASTAFAGGEGKAIFIMDAEGNIFVSMEQTVGKFHHSSFLAGKPVAGAGEISVKQGTIKLITRRSGHYTPGPEYQQQVLGELKKRGINIDKIRRGRGF